ncbi:MAG TPA: hypothetical protein VGF75_08205 [Candidatus Saccharimonadales bacterium]|jgi:hypothetical protein
MVVITSDQITPELLAALMIDRNGASIDVSADLHADIEIQLRTAPASTEVAKLLLSFALAEIATGNTSMSILNILESKNIKETKETSNIAIRFLTMGIIIGMNLTEKLVRNAGLERMAKVSEAEADKASEDLNHRAQFPSPKNNVKD